MTTTNNQQIIQLLKTVLTLTDKNDNSNDKKLLTIETDIHHHKIDSEESDDCYLCLEKLDSERNFIALTCGHKLHFECFIKNTELGTNPNKCGYCRRDCITNELKQEIKNLKRESLAEGLILQEQYLEDLRQRFNIREPLRRPPIRRQPIRRPRRRTRNNNLNNNRNTRQNNNRNLVISVLNTEGNEINLYLTIHQITDRLNGRLGEGAIRRHINSLVSTNRVQVGRGNNGARNYRLVINHNGY